MKFLFGVAVATALGFGAREAGAAPSAAAACTYNPPAGHVGACSSSANCAQTCLSYFPENGGVSTCRNGCCLCAT